GGSARAPRTSRGHGRLAAGPMSVAVRLIGAIWLTALIVIGGFAYLQAVEERRSLLKGFDQRAAVLNEALKQAAEPALARGSRPCAGGRPRGRSSWRTQSSLVRWRAKSRSWRRVCTAPRPPRKRKRRCGCRARRSGPRSGSSSS